MVLLKTVTKEYSSNPTLFPTLLVKKMLTPHTFFMEKCGDKVGERGYTNGARFSEVGYGALSFSQEIVNRGTLLSGL
jgi:hypothetical protein